MSLFFWNKLFPDGSISPRPFVWASLEDVVRENIVVPERRYYRDNEIVVRITVDVVVSLKYFGKLADQKFVLTKHLAVVSRISLIVVMAC